MQIGFCTDPATLATLPTRPDCDFIEGHVVNFLTPEAPDADFAPRVAALRACGFPMPAANVLLPAALKCSGPDIDYARLDRYAQTVFRRAREIGMTIIVFGSAGARMVPEGFPLAKGFEQYVDILKQFGPLIRHAHLAENKDRAAPGVNGEDFRPYLRALRQTGYNDRLALEPTWTDLPNQLGPALIELRRQLADAGY